MINYYIKDNRAFSLVELIMMIGILVILVAMLLPNVLGYISSTRSNSDLVAARQIYMAGSVSIAQAKKDKIYVSKWTQEDIKKYIVENNLLNITDFDIDNIQVHIEYDGKKENIIYVKYNDKRYP